jgi:hypothetical protein
MSNAEKGRSLSEMALGGIPSDTMVINGGLFNIFTGEFIKGQSIRVNGKALVEPRKVSLRRSGVRWEKPVLMIGTPRSPPIPHLRMAHQRCELERQKNSFP